VNRYRTLTPAVRSNMPPPARSSMTTALSSEAIRCRRNPGSSRSRPSVARAPADFSRSAAVASPDRTIRPSSSQRFRSIVCMNAGAPSNVTLKESARATAGVRQSPAMRPSTSACVSCAAAGRQRAAQRASSRKTRWIPGGMTEGMAGRSGAACKMRTRLLPINAGSPPGYLCWQSPVGSRPA